MGSSAYPQEEVNARMKLLRRRNEYMNPDFRLNATNETKVFLRLIKAFSPAQLRGLAKLIEETTPLVSRKWFGEQVAGIG